MDDTAARDFDAVLRVIAGERVALDDGASKLLLMMFVNAVGCDAAIDREKLVVDFGHRRPRGYFTCLGPPMVSQLLQSAGLRGPATTVRAWINLFSFLP